MAGEGQSTTKASNMPGNFGIILICLNSMINASLNIGLLERYISAF